MIFDDCITARKKFRKGDRVTLSTAGCVHMPELVEKKSLGRVVGFGQSYNLVRILIKGFKNPRTFHAGFWERI